MEKTIELMSKLVKLDNGKSFTSFRAKTKNNEWITCSFTTKCDLIPTESCKIVVDTEKINISYKSGYPKLWVNDVIRIEPISRKNDAEVLF